MYHCLIPILLRDATQMQRIRKTSIALLTAIAAIAASPAVATPIVGTAIDYSTGDPIASGDGWYDFYIPLDGVENYDGSLVPDYCNTNIANQCLGGVLNMKMHFAADWMGQTTVGFHFDDLDIDGFNDTDYFFEVLGLIIEDSGGTELFSLNQSEVAGLLTGNSNAQQLVFDFNTTGEFYVHLTFGTEFNDPPHRRYRNTLESIYGSAVSVPEPGTLALLGAGLLLLAFSQRRKRLGRISVKD